MLSPGGATRRFSLLFLNILCVFPWQFTVTLNRNLSSVKKSQRLLVLQDLKFNVGLESVVDCIMPEYKISSFFYSAG